MQKKMLLASLLFSSSVFAHQVELNQSLPAVNVLQEGELVIQGDAVVYQGWSSNTLKGKVRVLQHIAGRSRVKEKNEALMDAIRQANFDRNHYQTTTIINAEDAIIATGAFVKRSAEEGKLKNPHTQVVLDQKSTVKTAWGLKEKESFIAVLDKRGTVQFVSEGKLSTEQIQHVLHLTQQLLAE